MPSTNPRAEELLVERALRPLDDREHWELHQLGVEFDETYDFAAASIALATIDIEPLPQAIAERILATSPAFEAMKTLAGVELPSSMRPGDIRTLPGVSADALRPRSPEEDATIEEVPTEQHRRRPSVAPVPQTPPQRPTPMPEYSPPMRAPSVVPVPAPMPVPMPVPMPGPIAQQPQPVDDLARARQGRRRSKLAIAAPWIAAAACLLLAVGTWLWQRQRGPSPAVAMSAAEARSALLGRATDVTTIAWTATADPTAKGASGDVVWSEKEQRGYMRFVGLQPNNPSAFQYQLWIFDKNRDDKYPVDGGVFDVASNGEVVVPITARLNVADPTLFAVTVEKPGGVVVSSRERIVVTAARKS